MGGGFSHVTGVRPPHRDAAGAPVGTLRARGHRPAVGARWVRGEGRDTRGLRSAPATVARGRATTHSEVSTRVEGTRGGGLLNPVASAAPAGTRARAGFALDRGVARGRPRRARLGMRLGAANEPRGHLRGVRAGARLVRRRSQVGEEVGHAGARPHGLREARIELSGPGEAAARRSSCSSRSLGGFRRPRATRRRRTRCGTSTRRSGDGSSGAARTSRTPSTSSAGTTTTTWKQLDIARSDAAQPLPRVPRRDGGGYRRGTWEEQARGSEHRGEGGADRRALRVAARGAASRSSDAMPGIRSGPCVAESGPWQCVLVALFRPFRR